MTAMSIHADSRTRYLPIDLIRPGLAVAGFDARTEPRGLCRQANPIALASHLPAPVVTSTPICLPDVICHRNHVLTNFIRNRQSWP
jgi:hypothetical protein